MSPVYIVLIAVAGVFVLINLTLLAFAIFIKKAAFGSRCDKNPLLKYFSAEDFSLSATELEIISSKKYQIRAILYKKEGAPPKDSLIIFCHGMGSGHIAYTTEISYFCNLGYTVLAPDYIGCNLSGGKGTGGFSGGRLTVQFAVEYARKNMPQYSKIFLVGHSWGGWSAICAGYAVKADKIVAVSAPDRADKAILAAAASRLPGFLTVILKPYVLLTCGDKSAAKLAPQCKCPVLLVHGSNDKTVPPANAVYYKAEGDNITKLLSEGKGHNPYNTERAEQKLAELSAALQNAEERGAEYFKNFDFSAATEEDPAVMEEIARFLA